jgi:hypothetical protein
MANGSHCGCTVDDDGDGAGDFVLDVVLAPATTGDATAATIATTAEAKANPKRRHRFCTPSPTHFRSWIRRPG